MKVHGLLLVATLALGGMVSNVHATPISFFTNLGNFENPPTGSAGTGFALVTMDVDANTLAIDASFSGLTGNTTAAHIHCCIAPPGNIGVATTTPSFPGFPLGVTAGTFSNVFDTSLASTFNASFVTANGGTADGAEARLFAGLLAGEAYFNIHTSTSAGGEIRGFLVQIPEPATLALTGGALAAIALIRRKSRRYPH